MIGSIGKKATNGIVVSAIALLAIAGLVVSWRFLRSDSSGPELVLPLVIIGGVLVLLVTLALTAVVFAGINLSDRTQALGLPEGSVRAVIALSLILLLAIVSIFMYSNLSSGGKVETTPPLTQEARDSFRKGIPNAQYLFEQATGTGDAARYIVYYRQTQSPASEDFAKQLLAILATLVTAVSSFYFGAKTAVPPVAGQQDGLRGTPVGRNINPQKFVRGTSGKLEITGDGLNSIREVKIANGGRQILATNVLSNANAVTCQLAVDLDAPLGAWDVILADGAGSPAKMTGALNIA